jgi:hypothetical protein
MPLHPGRASSSGLIMENVSHAPAEKHQMQFRRAIVQDVSPGDRCSWVGRCWDQSQDIGLRIWGGGGMPRTLFRQVVTVSQTRPTRKTRIIEYSFEHAHRELDPEFGSSPLGNMKHRMGRLLKFQEKWVLLLEMQLDVARMIASHPFREYSHGTSSAVQHSQRSAVCRNERARWQLEGVRERYGISDLRHSLNAEGEFAPGLG